MRAHARCCARWSRAIQATTCERTIRRRVARIGDLSRLDVPVLIVNGEYDSDTRIGAGAELARALPQARLAVIPGAGHLSNLDNPAAYNKVLSEYVSCRAELV